MKWMQNLREENNLMGKFRLVLLGINCMIFKLSLSYVLGLPSGKHGRLDMSLQNCHCHQSIYQVRYNAQANRASPDKGKL